MTVQDEVTWLLGVIKEQWPGDTFPNTIRRINRDEPVILETGERSSGINLQNYTAVGVATGSVDRDLFGTDIRYRVNTTLDVRVEAQVDSNWGDQMNVSDFNTLVAYVQNAINSQITYPDVDTGDEDIGRICYLDLRIENENDLSSGDRDYYGTEFSVRLRGNSGTVG